MSGVTAIIIAVINAIKMGLSRIHGHLHDASMADYPEAKVELEKPLESTRKAKKELVIGDCIRDDREHDWLARQIREEAAIYRKGSMLDLGASHERGCEAAFIKEAHRLRHLRIGRTRPKF
ncbi:MAG: hypothetical protein IJU59_03265 [Firmicutes bacterium]|nr:hypothetical protein [Bacillota bacterium]